ncbi:hypothetical protein EVAR_57002_1 [Eumeta japonica]|uniref:Uncharacterized protein n=1 Tax=Eumeta variegata TaxID=151549 RepID=A0A4C1ZA85_EUMVA|nr:hypothetical protein EVAR_57002_1 [Eumeta japonica]
MTLQIIRSGAAAERRAAAGGGAGLMPRANVTSALECVALYIKQLKVPSEVKYGSEDPVILDVEYDLEHENNNRSGLVVKWLMGDHNHLVYQWIPPFKPQGSGSWKDFIDTNYVASSGRYTLNTDRRVNMKRTYTPSLSTVEVLSNVWNSVAGPGPGAGDCIDFTSHQFYKERACFESKALKEFVAAANAGSMERRTSTGALCTRGALSAGAGRAAACVNILHEVRPPHAGGFGIGAHCLCKLDAEGDPLQMYRALKFKRAIIAMTSNYTCLVSTYDAEERQTKPMIIYIFLFLYTIHTILVRKHREKRTSSIDSQTQQIEFVKYQQHRPFSLHFTAARAARAARPRRRCTFETGRASPAAPARNVKSDARRKPVLKMIALYNNETRGGNLFLCSEIKVHFEFQGCGIARDFKFEQGMKQLFIGLLTCKGKHLYPEPNVTISSEGWNHYKRTPLAFVSLLQRKPQRWSFNEIYLQTEPKFPSLPRPGERPPPPTDPEMKHL